MPCQSTGPTGERGKQPTSDTTTRQRTCPVAVVLDTDRLPPADRADAVISTLKDSFVSSYIRPENPDDPVAARLDNWTFGTTNILRAALPAVRLERTARQARNCP